MWCSLVKTIGSRTEQTIHQVLLRLACVAREAGQAKQAGNKTACAEPRTLVLSHICVMRREGTIRCPVWCKREASVAVSRHAAKCSKGQQQPSQAGTKP